ncbi:hypothetical protein CHS0354_001136, partial [Potamilus streckersoni]
QFKVRIGNDFSSNNKLDNGTTQGIVIIQSLLNMMVNSLSNQLNDSVEISKILDDICIWKASNPNNATYIKNLQDNLDSWATN